MGQPVRPVRGYWAGGAAEPIPATVKIKKSHIKGLYKLGKVIIPDYPGYPTFAEVKPESELFRDEVFGPVLTFTKFETDEEAINLANDTRYGLAGYIATNDLKRAHRAASQIEAGSIYVNQPEPSVSGRVDEHRQRQNGFIDPG